jgi:23S rRNA (pseudouridine1915-N3)-methyltransferase
MSAGEDSLEECGEDRDSVDAEEDGAEKQRRIAIAAVLLWQAAELALWVGGNSGKANTAPAKSRKLEARAQSARGIRASRIGTIVCGPTLHPPNQTACRSTSHSRAASLDRSTEHNARNGPRCLSKLQPHQRRATFARVSVARAGALVCGPRVTIYSVGKTKEKWLQSAIDLYTSRLRSVLEVDCVWVRDDQALAAQAAKAKGSCIVLDERGQLCTSVEFSSRLFEALEAGGSRVSFFIGGADGLPPSLKADHSRLVSLSKLTFTHQMARLLLVEQIYRATEIAKGSGYHKD